jgi:hypothetical protein
MATRLGDQRTVLQGHRTSVCEAAQMRGEVGLGIVTLPTTSHGCRPHTRYEFDIPGVYTTK